MLWGILPLYKFKVFSGVGWFQHILYFHTVIGEWHYDKVIGEDDTLLVYGIVYSRRSGPAFLRWALPSSCRRFCSALMIEAVRISETSIYSYGTTWRYVQKGVIVIMIVVRTWTFRKLFLFISCHGLGAASCFSQKVILVKECFKGFAWRK
jgi:hypothetical protein